MTGGLGVVRGRVLTASKILGAAPVLVGFGLSAGSARAVTFTQQTLAFSGLRRSLGIAVDGGGDVFVVDAQTGRVVEVPAGGSQQTLPFSGLSGAAGVAVDGGGRVRRRHAESAGSSVGLASVTACTLLSGGAFAATQATLLLYSSSGQLLESATAALGDLGSWAGSLRVPADSANGTTYVVSARCTNPAGVMAQAYRPATFTVQAPTVGRKGQTAPAGPRLTGERSHCVKSGSRKSCTYTFVYAVTTAMNHPAIATATVKGHRRVMARGRIRHHKLTLAFGHLGRGRYKLILLALRAQRAQGKPIVLGHTTIAVS